VTDGSTPLEWLQQWYLAQCDGEWEHHEGVTIESLDNPGWRIRISVKGTPVEGHPYERTIDERTEQDWIHAWLEGGEWLAGCGPLNLGEVVNLFRTWVEEP
jgi:hypothetical protein